MLHQYTEFHRLVKLEVANDTVRADTIYLFIYFTYCTEHYRYYGL